MTSRLRPTRTVGSLADQKKKFAAAESAPLMPEMKKPAVPAKPAVEKPQPSKATVGTVKIEKTEETVVETVKLPKVVPPVKTTADKVKVEKVQPEVVERVKLPTETKVEPKPTEVAVESKVQLVVAEAETTVETVKLSTEVHTETTTTTTEVKKEEEVVAAEKPAEIVVEKPTEEAKPHEVEVPVEPVEVAKPQEVVEEKQQPVEEQPAIIEEVKTQPIVVESVAAEPDVAQPVAVEPVVAEPVAAETVPVEQPVAVEPAAVETVTVAVEPVVVETRSEAPVPVEPVEQPAKVEPVEVVKPAEPPVAKVPVKKTQSEEEEEEEEEEEIVKPMAKGGIKLLVKEGESQEQQQNLKMSASDVSKSVTTVEQRKTEVTQSTTTTTNGPDVVADKVVTEAIAEAKAEVQQVVTEEKSHGETAKAVEIHKEDAEVQLVTLSLDAIPKVEPVEVRPSSPVAKVLETEEDLMSRSLTESEIAAVDRAAGKLRSQPHIYEKQERTIRVGRLDTDSWLQQEPVGRPVSSGAPWLKVAGRSLSPGQKPAAPVIQVAAVPVKPVQKQPEPIQAAVVQQRHYEQQQRYEEHQHRQQERHVQQQPQQFVQQQQRHVEEQRLPQQPPPAFLRHHEQQPHVRPAVSPPTVKPIEPHVVPEGHQVSFSQLQQQFIAAERKHPDKTAIVWPPVLKDTEPQPVKIERTPWKKTLVVETATVWPPNQEMEGPEAILSGIEPHLDQLPRGKVSAITKQWPPPREPSPVEEIGASEVVHHGLVELPVRELQLQPNQPIRVGPSYAHTPLHHGKNPLTAAQQIVTSHIGAQQQAKPLVAQQQQLGQWYTQQTTGPPVRLQQFAAPNPTHYSYVGGQPTPFGGSTHYQHHTVTTSTFSTSPSASQQSSWPIALEPTPIAHQHPQHREFLQQSPPEQQWTGGEYVHQQQTISNRFGPTPFGSSRSSQVQPESVVRTVVSQAQRYQPQGGWN